jgi:hypothetical protein
VRDLNLDEASGSRGVYRLDYLRDKRLDKRPAALAEHDDGNLSAHQILLIPQISVRCDKDFEAGSFGLTQQLAIA